MIRAITHGEISSALYSQMADDLEQAHQLRKKENNGSGGARKTSGGKKQGAKKAQSKGEGDTSTIQENGNLGVFGMCWNLEVLVF